MTWVYNITNSNAPTDAAEVIGVAVVMTALALLIVVLRVYVRWGILNVFGIGTRQIPPPPSIDGYYFYCDCCCCCCCCQHLQRTKLIRTLLDDGLVIFSWV